MTESAPDFVLEAGSKGRVRRVALHMLKIIVWLFAMLVFSLVGVVAAVWWFVEHP